MKAEEKIRKELVASSIKEEEVTKLITWGTMMTLLHLLILKTVTSSKQEMEKIATVIPTVHPMLPTVNRAAGTARRRMTIVQFRKNSMKPIIPTCRLAIELQRHSKMQKLISHEPRRIAGK